MKEFINFWKNYANFKGRTSRRGYWLAVLFVVMATVLVGVVSSFIGGPQTTLVSVGGVDFLRSAGDMEVTFRDGDMNVVVDGTDIMVDGEIVVDTEPDFELQVSILFSFWSLALIVPLLAIQVRRLRDAGKHWAWMFIRFLPIGGSIILIILLCMPPVADDGTQVV